MFLVNFDCIIIFFANLTWFFIFSTLISLLAPVAAVWIGSCADSTEKNKFEDEDDQKIPRTRGLQARYKLARQKLVERKLTPSQRHREKLSESQTLVAVLELLQENKEMFQISTMDELKDQLNLYRSQ